MNDAPSDPIAYDEFVADLAKQHDLAMRVGDMLEGIFNEIEARNRKASTSLGSAAPAAIATALFFMDATHKRLDEMRKRYYHEKDHLDKKVLPAALEAAGTDIVRVPELARSFSLQTKYSASFVDKDKGFEWLRGRGSEDLIQETVNAGTLAAFVKSLIIDEGVDPPEDIVKVSTYQTIGVTKYTPKGDGK